jgi:23S rRNA (guanine745-N1)-methyltransferase
MWICPNCAQGLAIEEGYRLVCLAGHSFDVAKEGYVNLLSVNRKGSQEPGDSKEMIAARRRVHGAGLYDSLAQAMRVLLQESRQPVAAAADLGCGEGYYTHAISEAFPAAEIYGIDIAKPAVRLAAKRYREGHFAVASAFDIPLAENSMDLAISVFAPLDPAQLCRLLRPGGLYLKVTPAANHLWQLRELLYDQPRQHAVESQQLASFELLHEEVVEYTLALSGELLRDVVAMTPYAHRGQRENRNVLEALEQLDLGMAFTLTLQRYQP